MTPRRLIEQAKYFAITVPQAIEVGRAAKEFTRQKLSEPFTVFTHMSDAMGQSRLERFYAFVQTNQGDLGEQLVRSGLGRNYGFKAVPPGLGSSRIELGKLQQFENEARQEKIGAWGISIGRLDVGPASLSSFSHYAVSTSPRQPALLTPITFPSTPMPSPLIPSRGTPGPNRPHSKQKTPLGRIDVNTATEKELTTVPGIGHVMAARIIAARPFQSANDLEKVSGIGDKKYGRIRAYFLSPIPLTFSRSLALWNGRAAIMRAAITCPIPGTVVSSFSVAVLTSILPSGVFCFECGRFGPGVPRLGINGLGIGVDGKVIGVSNAGCRGLVETA